MLRKLGELLIGIVIGKFAELFNRWRLAREKAKILKEEARKSVQALKDNPSDEKRDQAIDDSLSKF